MKYRDTIQITWWKLKQGLKLNFPFLPHINFPYLVSQVYWLLKINPLFHCRFGPNFVISFLLLEVGINNMQFQDKGNTILIGMIGRNIDLTELNAFMELKII